MRFSATSDARPGDLPENKQSQRCVPPPMGRKLNARLAIREKQAKLSRLLTQSSSVDSGGSCLKSSTSSTSYHRRYKARTRLHKPQRGPPCARNNTASGKIPEESTPSPPHSLPAKSQTQTKQQQPLHQINQLSQNQSHRQITSQKVDPQRYKNIVSPPLTQSEQLSSLIAEPNSKLRDTTVSTATSSINERNHSARTMSSNKAPVVSGIQGIERKSTAKEIWKMQSDIPLTTTIGDASTTTSGLSTQASSVSTNHTNKYPLHKFKEDKQLTPAAVPLIDTSVPMDLAVEEEYRHLRKYNLDLKNERTEYDNLLRKLKVDLNDVTKNYQNNTIEWQREILALKSQITDREIQYARQARAMTPNSTNMNHTESDSDDQKPSFSWIDRINKSEAKPNRETLLHYLRQSESLIATLNSSLKSETLALDAIVEEREERLQHDTDLIRNYENQVLDIRRKRNKKKGGRSGILLPW